MKILLPLFALGALVSCRSDDAMAAENQAASEAPEVVETIEEVAEAPEVPGVESEPVAQALPEIRYFMIADT